MNTTSEQIYKYVKYLTAHIARVREAVRRFIDMGGVDYLLGESSPVAERMAFAGRISSRAASHDKSKWQIDEFFPYLNHFYPNSGVIPEEGEDPDFDRACELHYSRNDHHDRYWRINSRSINDMPDEAICEMLADWVSMSVYSERSPLIWYEENKDEVLEGMDSEHLSKVDYLLRNYFVRIYEEISGEIQKMV